ncbi:sigma-70 family RNA polymerase sigma factor [Bacillaceae bacterium S4-13-56]
MEEFQDVVIQYEPMVYHIMNRLGIRDYEQEFYQEGLLALWEAYRTYEESKGKFNTYAYSLIRNRLIDLIRSKSRKQEKLNQLVEELTYNCPSYTMNEEVDPEFWRHLRSILTDNQWNWLIGSVLEGKTSKMIALEHGTTVSAVKKWAELAKQKLRRDPRVRQWFRK